MNKMFNDFSWHDATLKYILIDRGNPGIKDIVELYIDWSGSDGSSKIQFVDCYELSMNMNFGVVASETILYAECLVDSDCLSSIRSKWAKVGIDLDKLKCFSFLTNSTNSDIRIYAMDFIELKIES